MESKTSSQTKARLIVMAVFVIGFAAGAFSLNLYQRLTSPASPRDNGDRTGFIIQKMNEKMDLSSDQQARIREILDGTGKRYLEIRKKMEPHIKDFEPQFNAVRQQSREEIRGVLNEKQLPKFEEMVREQDSLREQEKEKINK
ncbi:MAG TPA: hypothetical protein VNI02_10615 [Blastocatellia bacterium]|jgi:hypothetical protein|nr:hypothetical protein [Blastocatellia bacterium]